MDSSKIYLDYAGFRTFGSMEQLKNIFNTTTVTIISQQFHNERAIYISSKMSIDAVGYNAEDVGTNYGLKTRIREKFSRVKVLMDLLVGVQPKFLGEKVEIK